MTSVAAVRAELERMYHETTPATIERDLKKAITLLKGLDGEAERAQVAVFMDGLSQMRSEWILARRAAARKKKTASATKTSATTASGAPRTKRSGKPRPKNKRKS